MEIFNKQENEKYFDLFHKEGEITEIRCIDLNNKNKPIEKFITSKIDYVKSCEELNKIEKLQVYSGHNPRTQNKGDAKSVKSVFNISLDCDPEREKGFEKKAANQGEVDLCEKEVDKIISYCSKIELTEPAKIFTGNGFKLNWKIPIIDIDDKNRDEIESKIKAFTKEMQIQFNNEYLKIDQTGDLPRIYKPCGVLSKKGDDTEDRPFRICKFISDGSGVEDEKLKDYILNLDVKKINKTIIPSSYDNEDSDKTRSAKEYGAVIKLIKSGKITFEEVDEEMQLYSKWSSAPQGYRDLTFKKALKITGEEVEKEQKRLKLNSLLNSQLSYRVGKYIKDRSVFYYRKETRDIQEATIFKNDNGHEFLGFHSINPTRFVSLIENYITFYYEVFDSSKKCFIDKDKSLSQEKANIVLQSPQFQQQMPIIDKIYNFPLPFIKDNKLLLMKKGYDERLFSWLPIEAPEIDQDMKLEEAKEIIENILGEFCFKSEQDKVNAIAGLLTPFLRGLYNKFNCRTPVMFYEANRERSGKDYLAGINSIIYQGRITEEPPINTGEPGGNKNDELRKKLMSALILGRTQLHFSNNRGFINNAVFEGFITAEEYSDRLLGKNELVVLKNCIDLSMSANTGYTTTADFINRCRFIRLFLDIENANDRIFNKPNLHNFVLENRGEILSALFCFVKYWFDKGQPKNSTPFASFPEWARVCGGIMESCGLGNPTEKDKEIALIGGDIETQDMKILFELCFKSYPNKWISKQQMQDVIKYSEEDIFTKLDLETTSGKTQLGLKIKKFTGRIFSDIRMILEDSSVRSIRQKFKFFNAIDSKSGHVGHVGHDSSIPIYNSNQLPTSGYKGVQGVQRVQINKFSQKNKELMEKTI